MWEKKVPGCFAGIDAPFGLHPSDHERAKVMLHCAFLEGASLQDVIEVATAYLNSHNVHEDYLKNQIRLINKFKGSSYKISKLASAWLVTWEGSEAPNDMEHKVFSILNPRRTDKYVGLYIEQAYADRNFTVAQKIIYMRRPGLNPYAAQWESADGEPRIGRIKCGINPFLLARKVRNLKIVKNNDGRSALS